MNTTRPTGPDPRLRVAPSARPDPSSLFDDIRRLARRLDPKDPSTPPWSWTNLTSEEADWLDAALNGFVDDYNRTYVTTIEEVIPACWRQHPALAHELPVQFWSWWTAHLDPRYTVNQAADYYTRILPAFLTRVATRLLGPGAVNCRKGNHARSSDPDVAAAVIAARTSGTGPARADLGPLLNDLRLTSFGSGQPGVLT
jgi:hypothetical protein